MSEKERKKSIAIIEELYPPDSQYPATKKMGEEFMHWALTKFINRYGWKGLDEAILKDMAYFCQRHEKMVENGNFKDNK